MSNDKEEIDYNKIDYLEIIRMIEDGDKEAFKELVRRREIRFIQRSPVILSHDAE